VSDRNRIVTPAVTQAVEQYVSKELHDAKAFSNREPLDDSGVWSLHALAGRIYALAWEDAERVVEERERHRQMRVREAATE
jgi:hypothetical protein